MGLFQTRDLKEGPMELAHLPNNTTFLLSKPWNFQFISCSGSKVIPFLLPVRRTFCIPICTGEIFFCMDFYTFHNTTFLCALHSLTDFICEGLNFVNVTKIECELIFVLQLVRHPWRNCQWCRPERWSCCPSPQRRFCQTLVSESKSKCQKFFRSFISQ